MQQTKAKRKAREIEANYVTVTKRRSRKSQSKNNIQENKANYEKTAGILLLTLDKKLNKMLFEEEDTSGILLSENNVMFDHQYDIDKPRRILNIFKEKDNLMFLIEWNQRNNGIVPEASILNHSVIGKYYPEMFREFKLQIDNLSNKNL